MAFRTISQVSCALSPSGAVMPTDRSVSWAFRVRPNGDRSTISSVRKFHCSCPAEVR
jgi:hypothetical protein